MRHAEWAAENSTTLVRQPFGPRDCCGRDGKTLSQFQQKYITLRHGNCSGACRESHRKLHRVFLLVLLKSRNQKRTLNPYGRDFSRNGPSVSALPWLCMAFSDDGIPSDLSTVLMVI